jgi:hypothetical protein
MPLNLFQTHYLRLSHAFLQHRNETNVAEPGAAANCSGPSRLLLPAEPTAQQPRQPSAVAELELVRRRYALSVKATILLVLPICALTAAAALAGEAVVSVTPAKLTLHPTALDDSSGGQSMVLSVSNRTDREWHFSNFYESWAPILLSPSGEVAQLGMARDATRTPQVTDYPVLKPNQRASAKRWCRVIRTEKGTVLLISDGTGGDFSRTVTPGEYRLSVSYRAQTDGPLFRLATERFGFERSQTWTNWSVSNWIRITIRDKAP